MDQKKFHVCFSHFIMEQKDNIYRLAFSYVKNSQNALDIVHDAIQKALLKRSSLTNQEAMKSWFYRIVINTALDFLRKNKKIQLVDEQFLEYSDSLQSHDQYEDPDLQMALDNLPIPNREIIVLRYFEDLKFEEIAEILDIPISTAKTRLYHSLKLLRIEMEEL